MNLKKKKSKLFVNVGVDEEKKNDIMSALMHKEGSLHKKGMDV